MGIKAVNLVVTDEEDSQVALVFVDVVKSEHMWVFDELHDGNLPLDLQEDSHELIPTPSQLVPLQPTCCSPLPSYNRVPENESRGHYSTRSIS